MLKVKALKYKFSELNRKLIIALRDEKRVSRIFYCESIFFSIQRRPINAYLRFGRVKSYNTLKIPIPRKKVKVMARLLWYYRFNGLSKIIE